MDLSVVIAQWLHVFFGIFWFGGTLYATFVVFPALARLQPVNARSTTIQLQRQISRVIPWVALATIVLGIVRGTVFGPIQTADQLTSTYGLWWLLGLLGSVALVVWGQYVISPSAERLNADEEAWAESTERPSPRLARLISRLRLVATIEVVGFAVVFSAMIAMHAVSEA